MLPFHHDPRIQAGRMRFNRVWTMLLLLIPVVALRVELSATRLSAVFGQPALDYHLPTSSFTRSGRRDSNPRSRAPTTMLRTVPGGLPLPYIPYPVRTGGFEPPISWSPTRRDARLRYVLPRVARAGIEQAFPA